MLSSLLNVDHAENFFVSARYDRAVSKDTCPWVKMPTGMASFNGKRNTCRVFVIFNLHARHEAFARCVKPPLANRSALKLITLISVWSPSTTTSDRQYNTRKYSTYLRVATA